MKGRERAGERRMRGGGREFRRETGQGGRREGGREENERRRDGRRETGQGGRREGGREENERRREGRRETGTGGGGSSREGGRRGGGREEGRGEWRGMGCILLNIGFVSLSQYTWTCTPSQPSHLVTLTTSRGRTSQGVLPYTLLPVLHVGRHLKSAREQVAAGVGWACRQVSL